jgi:hypothetical protein
MATAGPIPSNDCHDSKKGETHRDDLPGAIYPDRMAGIY